MYTRYEVINDEKSIGFLSGLNKIIDSKLADELMEPFNKYLNIPDFYYIKGKNKRKNVYAYFTDLGVEKFQKEINAIINEIQKNGYNIQIIKQEKVGTARLIYQDKYQVLIRSKEKNV